MNDKRHLKQRIDVCFEIEYMIRGVTDKAVYRIIDSQTQITVINFFCAQFAPGIESFLISEEIWTTLRY